MLGLPGSDASRLIRKLPKGRCAGVAGRSLGAGRAQIGAARARVAPLAKKASGGRWEACTLRIPGSGYIRFSRTRRQKSYGLASSVADDAGNVAATAVVPKVRPCVTCRKPAMNTKRAARESGPKVGRVGKERETETRCGVRRATLVAIAELIGQEQARGMHRRLADVEAGPARRWCRVGLLDSAFGGQAIGQRGRCPSIRPAATPKITRFMFDPVGWTQHAVQPGVSQRREHVPATEASRPRVPCAARALIRSARAIACIMSDLFQRALVATAQLRPAGSDRRASPATGAAVSGSVWREEWLRRRRRQFARPPACSGSGRPPSWGPRRRAPA